MKTEQFLKEAGVNYTIGEYDENERDINQVAVAVRLTVENMVKTLLLKNENNQYIMILVSITEKVDMKIINSNLIGKYSMAKFEDVEKITGYKVGAVSPILVNKGVKIYIDEKLLDKEIGIATGEKGKEFILNATELSNAIEAISMNVN